MYNLATYPDLVSLFETLRVPQDNSSMSFSSSVDLPDGTRLEWGSDSLDALFADRHNLARTSLYAMLWDMRRFNTAVHAFVERAEQHPEAPESAHTLSEFLATGGYSQTFVQCYLVPMVSSVWSASFQSALRFPARTLFRFFVNHGLAQTFGRPQWRTPLRRSRDYVAAVLEDLAAHGASVHLDTPVTKVTRSSSGVRIFTNADCDVSDFDHVIFATHADVVLKLLGTEATAAERRILGAFQYAENKSYVHTDAALMPSARGTWSAWNFVSRRVSETGAVACEDGAASRTSLPREMQPVCVSYWLNKLQNLNRANEGLPDIFVTLNPCVPIDPAKVLHEDTFAHPQFTEEAVRAQGELQNVIQGENRSWFCGAYARFGFHEDGLMTGLDVAERLAGYRIVRPWLSKASLAINNNYRKFALPFQSPRTMGIAYLGGLVVVSLVGARIQAGMSILARRLTPDEPSVVLSTGSGILVRFGHTTAASSQPGLVTIRSAQLLARVTDAIRHHRDLVPVAVASFVAGEIDCPRPADLTRMLAALILAQRKGPEVGHGLQGQMHLAELLLWATVGGFRPVGHPDSKSRLAELLTAIYTVVRPCWWMTDDGSVQDVGRGWASCDVNGADGRADNPNLVVGMNSVHTVLELAGDLCAATVSRLQQDRRLRATIVVAVPERSRYVVSKAKLLHVHRQLRIVAMKDFLNGPIQGLRARYNYIISPSIVNACEGLFPSMGALLEYLWGLLPDGGVAELGFAACDDIHARARMRHGALSDAMFCGDRGYRLWPARAILDAANAAGFVQEKFSQLPAAKAAFNVESVIARVFKSLAEEKMTPEETRRRLGQFCLWQAALECKVATRAVVFLRRPAAGG